jgi:broad specificity phosphatase PhoE
MRLASEFLKNDTFDRVFTSNLNRTIEGAGIIIRDRKIEIEEIQEFNEINFGRWEGLTLEEIKEKDEELFVEWRKSLWNFNYPEGDNREEFLNKVKSGIDRVLNMVKSGCILFVLHKGIIRTILEHLAEIDVMKAPLGSIQELSRTNGKWNIVKLDYTEHLPRIIG